MANPVPHPAPPLNASPGPSRVLTPRQRAALPDSSYDRIVRWLNMLLPALAAVVAVLVIAWPFVGSRDISFVLSKDRVAIAHERLRVSSATYRGEDGKGQPFLIKAKSAVQKTSREPVVRMSDLSAELAMTSGPATVTAPSGRYDMQSEQVAIDGPVSMRTTDGYALDTENVSIDLKTRRAVSRSAVSGRMPIGSFTAGRLTTDMRSHVVVLDQRARLHIDQRRAR